MNCSSACHTLSDCISGQNASIHPVLRYVCSTSNPSRGCRRHIARWVECLCVFEMDTARQRAKYTPAPPQITSMMCIVPSSAWSSARPTPATLISVFYLKVPSRSSRTLPQAS
jgi:hypothetical protein